MKQHNRLIQGKFQCIIQTNGRTITDKFYVTTSKGKTLLGKNTIILLDILRVGTLSTTHLVLQNDISPEIPASTQDIIRANSEVFQGMGTLNNYELMLHINKDITPIQQPIRRLPFHTEEKVSQELKILQKLDIIEPIKGQTT